MFVFMPLRSSAAELRAINRTRNTVDNLRSTEHTTKLRASLTQLKGKFIRKDWQESCAQTIRHVWFTDCQSLHDYLCNPIAAGCEDKRLEIDLEGLREELWFNADWSLKDQITENQTDKPRWVDTSAMICDPFTKVGREDFKDRMVQTLQTANSRS